MAKKPAAAGGDTTEPSAAPADDTMKEPYTGQLYFPTMMTVPNEEAIAQVEQAINDYIGGDLGISRCSCRLPSVGAPSLGSAVIATGTAMGLGAQRLETAPRERPPHACLGCGPRHHPVEEGDLAHRSPRPNPA